MDRVPYYFSFFNKIIPNPDLNMALKRMNYFSQNSSPSFNDHACKEMHILFSFFFKGGK